LGHRPDNKETRTVYSTETGDLRRAAAPPSGDNKPAQPARGPVKVWLDAKSRRGKAMTRVSGIQHNPQKLDEIAKTLKVLCGAGGTVEGRDVLIQGDHRDRVVARLMQMGIAAKKI
jgi:translation initiation factor 1